MTRSVPWRALPLEPGASVLAFYSKNGVASIHQAAERRIPRWPPLGSFPHGLDDIASRLEDATRRPQPNQREHLMPNDHRPRETDSEVKIQNSPG